MPDDLHLASLFATRPSPPRDGMAWIPGGAFLMGSDHHYAEEGPTRRVSVDGFWIDVTPVTNAQFASFVDATGWITNAERPADPRDYPGARPGMLDPASLVFAPPTRPAPPRGLGDWWAYRRGADWRHPAGPQSDLNGLDDHPVVHVAWSDVEAYAAWAGAALPTEAEWEFAARGKLDGATYAWGEDFMPHGRRMANTWQGVFPWLNLKRPAWPLTSPVGAFPPNGYGLHDMIGNVWEWTRDWWSTSRPVEGKACCSSRNPTGGCEQLSHDPATPTILRRVLKGGSHLCAPDYCQRYRPAARHAQPIDTSTSHVGFRCIVRPPPSDTCGGKG